MKNIMLHLGLGSFHRAHQAVYIQNLIDSGDESWALAGGNLRADMLDVVAALQQQNGRYTLETVAPTGERFYQTIRAIEQIIQFDEQLSGLVALGAAAQTKIISFTVTEAGYYLTDTDELDLSFVDLAADLARVKSGAVGYSIYGALVTILKARMAHNSGAVTLLNCDNLRHNGKRFRQGLLQFVDLLGDAPLKHWIETHTTSPNAMVDRITPRPTEQVRASVLAATGVDDPAALMGETFIQWVIEDNFIAGRPAWENVGVEMVESVTPYEEAKIRLLNATHTCIAWAGTLRGYTYIHEGTLDRDIYQWAYDYVTQDAIPCLTPSPLNLSHYRDVVLERFSNVAICDTNQRVAMDGYSKIPGYIVPTIRDCLARGASFDAVAVLPALFLAYLQVWHRGGVAYEYQDQAMDVAGAHAICEADDSVAAFCADSVLWGSLANDMRLLATMRQAYATVQGFGMR
ncbi:MAG: D-arabinitol 4-dehydrogenase [Formosimonas sp.]